MSKLLQILGFFLFVTCLLPSARASATWDNYCDTSDVSVLTGTHTIGFRKPGAAMPGPPAQSYVSVVVTKGTTVVYDERHTKLDFSFSHPFDEAGDYRAKLYFTTCAMGMGCRQSWSCVRTVKVSNNVAPTVVSRTHSKTSSFTMGNNHLFVGFTVRDPNKNLTSYQVKEIRSGQNPRVVNCARDKVENRCGIWVWKNWLRPKTYNFTMKAVDSLGQKVEESVTVNVIETNTAPRLTVKLGNEEITGHDTKKTVPVGGQLSFNIKAIDSDRYSGNQLDKVEITVGNTTHALTEFDANCNIYNSGNYISCSNTQVPIDSNVDKIAFTVTDKAGAIASVSTKVTPVLPPQVVSFTASSTSPFVNDAITLTANTTGTLNEYYICAVNGKHTAVPGGCSSSIIYRCNKNDASCSYTLQPQHYVSEPGLVTYFVYAEDTFGNPDAKPVYVNYSNYFGIQITPPSQTKFLVNEPITFSVLASALSKDVTHLDSLTISSSNTSISQSNVVISPNIGPSGVTLDKSVDANGAKRFNVTWTPQIANATGENSQTAITVTATARGGQKVTSVLGDVQIINPVPLTPSTPRISIDPTSAKGVYNVRFTNLNNTKTLKVSATLDGSSYSIGNYNSIEVNQVATSFTLQTKYADHGKTLRLEAYGINSNGSQTVSGLRGSNTQIVENREMTPHDPMFTTSATQTSGNYTLQWANNNDGVTKSYRVRYWAGLPSDKASSTQTELPITTGLTQSISQPKAGRFTYEIEACNSQGTCKAGQQLTIEHVAPYADSAKITQCAGTSDCPTGSAKVEVTGVGLHATQSELFLRIRKTGETYAIKASDLTLTGNTLSGLTNERAYLATLNGGAEITITNGILDAQSAENLTNKIILDDTGNSTHRPELLGREYTVSKKNFMYVGGERGLEAFSIDSQNGLTPTWVYAPEAELSNEVVAKPIVKSKTLPEDGINRLVDDIYFGSLNHRFYRAIHDPLAEAGRVVRKKWHLQTRGEIRAPAQFDQNDNLYVGSMDEALYSVDAQTGMVQWHYSFPRSGGIVSQPSVSDTGKIYVTTQDGELHVITSRMIDENSIKWQDIGALANKYSAELAEWEQLQWQPNQDFTEVVSLTKAMMVLLQKSPTKAEISFMAYLLANGHPYNEILNALINTDPELSSASNQAFIDTLFDYLLGSEQTENHVISTDKYGSGGKDYWVTLLDNGFTRAEIAGALLASANQQYGSATYQLLYHFYNFCLLSNNCSYDYDSDNDGISNRVEDELGLNSGDGRDGLVAPTLAVSGNAGLLEFSFTGQGLVDEYHLYVKKIPELDYEKVATVTATNSPDKLATLSDTYHNGTYQFKALACVTAETLKHMQASACSNNFSDSVRVTVSGSVAGSPVSVKLPNEQAAKQAPSSEVLLAHAKLQPTVGSFRVTESGSVSYSIPIALPAGIAGVQPDVALNYGSQGPDSMVALGWSLAASSSVSRCRQTPAQDGQFKGLTFSDEDRYCLDGQRLIRKATINTDVYASIPGTIVDEYTTEIDSQVVVFKLASGNDNSFVVLAKDGSVKYYGDSAQSRVTIKDASSTTQTMSWMLSKVEDNLQSEKTAIFYHYANKVGAAELGQSEVVLSAIEYSGNRVELNYSVGEVRNVAFVDQAKMTQRARLENIIVKNHNSAELANYKLGFKTAANGVRLLESVSHCRGNVCRKPITFEYNQFTNTNNLDFQAHSTVFTKGHWDNKISAVTLVDTQGDGQPELATLERVGANQYELCLYQGNTYQNPTRLACREIRRYDNEENVTVFAIDHDNDGKQSLMVNMRNEHVDDRFATFWSHFALSDNNSISSINMPSGWYSSEYMREVKPADLNGDGYADLVFKHKRDDATLYVKVWDAQNESFGAKRALQTLDIDVSFNSFGDFTQKGTDWAVLDMNFDGLADIVALQCDRSGKCGDYEAKRISVHYNQGLQSNGDFKAFTAESVAVAGKIEHLMPADVNGDGLVDLIYLETASYNSDVKRWRALLNLSSERTQFRTINLITAKTAGTDQGLVNENIRPMSLDLDKDGRVELFFKAKKASNWYQLEWSPVDEQFVEVTDSAFLLDINADRGDFAFFSDYDNDGVVDIIRKDSNNIIVNYNLSQSATEGLMTDVTQGYGNKTTITYALMTDSAVYSDLVENLAEDTELFQGQNLKVSKGLGASPLVRTVQTDSPGTRGADQNFRNSVNYHYQGARMQFGGRGMLGFKVLQTEMVKGGATFTTSTRYHKAFPLTGMPYSTEKRMRIEGAETLLSRAVNQYENKGTTHLNGVKSYQVYNSGSRECSALVDSELTASIYSCTDTSIEQDSYGNIKAMVVGTYEKATADVSNFIANGATGAEKLVSTSNDYGTDTEMLRLGRLQSTSVTHFAKAVKENDADDTIIRNTEFTYYPRGSAHAFMLQTETVGKGLGCNYELTTEHFYDAVGNKVKVGTTNSGCGISARETRFTETVFDNSGRHADYTKKWSSIIPNQVLVSSKIAAAGHQRNEFGLPLQTVDANGVVTEHLYDTFGSKIGSYSLSGTQSYTFMSSCPSTNCSVQSNKYVNGKLQEVQFIDRLGKPYSTKQIDVKGNWLTTELTFDVYGRTVNTTEPGAKAVTTGYDVLDRVVKVTDLNNGTVTSTNFSGLSSTIKITGSGILEQVKTSIKNIYGLRRVEQNNGGPELKFYYNALGEQVAFYSGAESNINKALIKIGYDALGRKTSQEDLNRGSWTYTYNAFGELETQTDARGVVSTNEYDGFGRKVRVSYTSLGSAVNEGDSIWQYGDPAKGEKLHQLIYSSQGSEWQQYYFYDSFGRAVATLTDLGGSTNCRAAVKFDTGSNDLQITDKKLADPLTSLCVIQQTAYDKYSRVAYQFDDYRRNAETGRYIDARGVAFTYQNGQVLKKTEAREGALGQTYYEILGVNTRGLVTSYNKGNVTMSVDYDSKGMVTSIASTSNYAYIQSESYSFDSLGNLIKRADQFSGTQNFHYDSLNRVLGINNVDLFKYSKSGNLISKADYRLSNQGLFKDAGVYITDRWEQAYGVGDALLHAITSRFRALGSPSNAMGASSGNIGTPLPPDMGDFNLESFKYDANGNQVQMLKNGLSYRTIDYSARNKAINIISNTESIRFAYDANNKRYKRVEDKKTIYYVGALELTIPNSGDKTIKRYIGNDAQQVYYSSGLGQTNWLFTDHQGSIVAITNGQFKLLKRFAYDVFGQQRTLSPSDADKVHYADELTYTVFDSVSSNLRAYTGHEPVSLGNDNSIIHMNGRLYDSNTGRFMQADPFVQAPMNLQNYNAYSYVLNNPLSYTDPSGYLFKKLGSFVKKYWRVIAAAVVTYFTAGAASGWAASWAASMGMTTTITAGTMTATVLSTTGSIFAGAVTGAIAGAAGGLVATGTLKGAVNGALSGAVFGGIGKAMSAFNVTNPVAQMGIHAVAGGVLSDIQGGNFGHGFVSAGIMKGVGKMGVSGSPGRVVLQAVAGGTISKLTGGKFANGAMTAAIQFVTNELQNSPGRMFKEWGDMWKRAGDSLKSLFDDTKTSVQKVSESITDAKNVAGELAIRGKNSHLGGTVGGSYMAGFAGQSEHAYFAVDVNKNICLVKVSCVRIGLGASVSGGLAFDINPALTPQLVEGTTVTTDGFFAEGGKGVFGSGAINFTRGDSSTMNIGLGPNMNIAPGVGAALGYQQCRITVASCM
ncbi:FG-GAP-like repeat-containing protein [Pseudoalteromonas luteoviolacea]|uniref:Fibronectin type-III domain-containing protein n=1 Tax=Pseudoalteromonas luteoviolacea NCIMB 1942 TaxID=1365253 RepID=A0A167BLB1_9GAMM|nr:FG-GAP-like repeat-containing protein [Pseudoalteromonas luteoviolacea]KZN46675.1 hypothetical protein N482_11615 [Pseudoalteromonas luteoviolacea NCIMB 1942]